MFGLPHQTSMKKGDDEPKSPKDYKGMKMWHYAFEGDSFDYTAVQCPYAQEGHWRVNLTGTDPKPVALPMLDEGLRVSCGKLDKEIIIVLRCLINIYIYILP